MPDGTTTLLGAIWDGAKWVWVALLSLLAWNAKRLHIRVDKIEDNYVSNTSFDKAVDRIRDDMKTYHQEIHSDINKLHDRIDKK